MIESIHICRTKSVPPNQLQLLLAWAWLRQWHSHSRIFRLPLFSHLEHLQFSLGTSAFGLLCASVL